jgi:predicted dehydrogenase
MTISTIINVGIVGDGNIARGRHLPCFKKHPNVRLAAISDVVVDLAESAAKEYEIPAVYTDYRDMFGHEKLDAVVICTPNKFHAPASIAALDAGLHVLCEKPMVLDPVEARAMVAAAERNGKILSIAFHYRHMAQVRAARRVVDAGELGHVYMARVYAIRRRSVPSWGTFVQKHIRAVAP